LGADALTRAMPAADAVGFSCAVPGLLHYDVPKEDGETERLLDALFAREDLARLVDGGVVSNVPARAAWEAVESGLLGTRNVCILAFDAFAPRVRASANTLFMGIQELARMNVLRQRKYATYTKTFRNVPSPLEFLGHLERYMRIAERGYAELSEDRGALARLMRPIPVESVLS
ncbi:MAG: patatin-like phospholipase family protein, partial [Candidatus Methylomirabilis sp.]|nr:patatin-like phospholipase family protein [Deltaproteobacteria bacterium]